MALTDTTIRNAKPREKQYKLHDDGGLFLLVRTTGGKLWRLKYRVNGKEQQLSFGKYPLVGLKEAREKRDGAKKLLAAGRDPGAEKKKAAIKSAVAAENTFGTIAKEFIEKRRKEGIAEATLVKLEWLASLLADPIGRLPVTEIDPPIMVAALKPIEAKGHHETANRARSFSSRVFRFAIASGRAIHDPAFSISDAFVKPKAISHAALIKPEDVGGLLRAIDGYDGNMSTKLALKAMQTAQDIIKILDLKLHPEGGWYRETFRDPHQLDGRAVSTAIYYLLEKGQKSHWHRVDAAEIWHWHAGAALALSVGTTDGVVVCRLGVDLAVGERPQAVVETGQWQSAESLGDWTLVGCTVAPGFEFAGFEMAPPGWQP